MSQIAADVPAIIGQTPSSALRPSLSIDNIPFANIDTIMSYSDLASLSANANIAHHGILGCFVHSLALGELQIIENGAIIFDDHGVISELLDFSRNPSDRMKLETLASLQDFTGKLIIPGFVDAHCHAPQYVFTGTGMDLPLLAWLEKYTFPAEARFQDVEFARAAYQKAIRRTLKCGTTTASYFATIHSPACRALCEVIAEAGQRAFVGKVSMDRNCPDFYIESTAEAVSEAEAFARHVLNLTPSGRDFLGMVDHSQPQPFSSSQQRKRVRSDSTAQAVDSNADYATAFTALDGEDDQALSSFVRPRAISFAEHQAAKRARTVSEISLSDWQQSSSNLTDMLPPAASSSAYFSSVYSSSSQQQQLVSLMNRLDTPRVMPVITPRFVPTCTSELLAGLGAIAKRYGLPVQSHMSESVNEIEWVGQLHPEASCYAGVYDNHGLLHQYSYLAHCCHSDDNERALMATRGASAVHCASSNFMLSSGVMDVRQFLSEGVKVAVGTDVAGGYSPSMLEALRQTIVASRAKGFQHACYAPPPPKAVGSDSPATSSISSSDDTTRDHTASPPTTTVTATAAAMTAAKKPYKSLSYSEAFHLCTMGGAEVLGMGNVLGNLLPGKRLDCLVVDVHAAGSPIDCFGTESAIDLFQKFLFLGDDRNIAAVFVDGRKVLG